MDDDEQLRILKQRPCVIQLCRDAFLQGPDSLTPTIYATPLRAMGGLGDADYLIAFGNKILNNPVTRKHLETQIGECAEDHPVVALVYRPNIRMTSRATLEGTASDHFERARTILALVTGNPVVPFAEVTAWDREDHFRLLRWPWPRRHRLGFGNTGEDFRRICAAIDQKLVSGDERFGFAMKSIADIAGEKNLRFAVARYFTLLEGLASQLKKGGVGSLDAVRGLLGGQTVGCIKRAVDGKEFDIDILGFALQLRNKLYHGVELKRSRLTAKYRASFDILESDQGMSILRRELQNMAELELMRWANGTSRGQSDAGGDSAQDPTAYAED